MLCLGLIGILVMVAILALGFRPILLILLILFPRPIHRCPLATMTTAFSIFIALGAWEEQSLGLSIRPLRELRRA